MKKVKLLLAACLVCSLTMLHAINFRENLLFSAQLDGAQMAPAINSNAKGIASVMLNKKRDTLSINLGIIGLTAQNVAIYEGHPGQNGTLLFNLSGYLSGNTVSTVLAGLPVKNNLSKLLRGDLYFLVGSTTNPAGEIRGQITLEADKHFVADLNGEQAVPMVDVEGYGLGSFGLSADNNTLDFKIICESLSGAITSAKLHTGSAGNVGPEVADLGTFITGKTIIGRIATTPAMLNSLLAGEIYLNIATNTNPAGELRSQLVLQKGISFDALANGAQMVPEINSPGKAVCVIRLSPGLDTLFYDAVVTGINSTIDYAHLHVGFAGEEYAALQVDFTPSINIHRIKGFKKGSGVSVTTINKLLISNLSLIVHTANYPGGEIRGQVVRFAREGYTMRMNGAQAVPPTSSVAYGSGLVSINRDETMAHYLWLAGNLSSQPTDAHFHNNVAGENGSVLYDLGPTMEVSGNDASGSGFWTNTDADPFSAFDATQFGAKKVYFNIHTDDYPDGEIRGQVLPGQIYYPLTSETNEPGSRNLSSIQVSPNPAAAETLVELQDVSAQQLLLRVVDMYGRSVSSATYKQVNGLFSETIDLRSLAPGVYWLTIDDGANIYHKKVMKH